MFVGAISAGNLNAVCDNRPRMDRSDAPSCHKVVDGKHDILLIACGRRVCTARQLEQSGVDNGEFKF